MEHNQDCQSLKAKELLFELCIEILKAKRDIEYFKHTTKGIELLIKNTGFNADEKDIENQKLLLAIKTFITDLQERVDYARRAISSDTSEQTNFGNISGQVRKARF